MAPYKCCVGGCDSTSSTHKLFCMPMNDNIRNLWMSLLVPTNPSLLGLTKNQLMSKRVCERHFDQTQFSQTGVRIRYSYPCLLTEKEIAHGVPLAKGYHILNDHTYCQQQEDNDNLIGGEIIIKGDARQEHEYSLPSTSFSLSTSHIQNQEDAGNIILDIAGQTRCEQEPSDTANLSSGMRPVFVDENKIRDSKQKSTSRKNRVQLSSETRRYIKQCTKIASNSELNILSSQTQAENLALMANFENLDKKAKAFLFMQLKLARKHKMARRFSLEDKLFGLALIKQSPGDTNYCTNY